MEDDFLIPRLKWAWDSTPLLDPTVSGEIRLDSFRARFGGEKQAWANAASAYRRLARSRRTQRLGETFELLIQAIMESHPDVARVVPNLPLPQGEIDLFFSLKSAPLHFIAFEVAVKFYIFDESIGARELRWIGPSRKDFLFKKMRRVIRIQVPRANTSEALAALRAIVPDAVVVDSIAWIRGELFADPNAAASANHVLSEEGGFHPQIELSPLFRDSAPENSHPLADRWQWICSPEDAAVVAGGTENSPDDRAQMFLLEAPTGKKRRAFVAPPGWSDRQPPDSM